MNDSNLFRLDDISRNSGRYPSLNVIVSPLDGTTLSPTLEILDRFSLEMQKPSSNVSNIQAIVDNHYAGGKKIEILEVNLPVVTSSFFIYDTHKYLFLSLT